ncbi:MAG: diguanylate cyclase [Telluria sp.]
MNAHDLQRQGMLESVLAAANIGMVVLDSERQVVLWNRWMAQHSGLTAEQVLGRDFFDVFPDLNNKRIEAAVMQALRGFPSVLSQTLHKAPFPLFAHAGGPRMQQAVAVTPVDVAGAARHCLIQISDVSAAVNRERLLRVQALELRSQTFSDGLTGIANRRHFDVAIEKEIRRAKRAATPLSLLMIDIDHFKSYNDHYGHQQGDDTLIRVAAALQAMVQRPMDLIARYGGEEFSVILPELDEAHALALAEHMRERVRALAIPHEFTGSSDPFVTVSIGIATQTVDHPTEVSTLIGAADRALYDAKHAGRNRVSVQRP